MTEMITLPPYGTRLHYHEVKFHCFDPEMNAENARTLVSANAIPTPMRGDRFMLETHDGRFICCEARAIATAYRRDPLNQGGMFVSTEVSFRTVEAEDCANYSAA